MHKSYGIYRDAAKRSRDRRQGGTRGVPLDAAKPVILITKFFGGDAPGGNTRTHLEHDG